MATEQLLVTLGVQDKGAKTQLSALNKELRTLDKEFKTVDKTSSSYEKGTETLGKKLDILKSKYDTQKTKLEVYRKQIENTKSRLEEKKKALETLTSTEGANEKQVQKLTSEITKMEQDIRQATREMGLTEAQLNQLESEIKDTTKTIQQKPFEDMKKDLEKLGSQIDNTGQKLEKLGENVSKTGDTLLKLSAPVVGFGAYAIKASMDFESAMSEVEAISGATGKDLEALEEKAKQMGASTSKSATDSANALSYMALAGWNTQQMLTGIEPILRLAESGNIDLARASDLVTDSMSALGIQVQDLDKYLDIVAQTQRKANTSADGMLEAYISVGGTLKNLNVPIEESATWLGILANRGIKSAEAGNSFNSVLVNVMGVSGQARDALKELGVSAWDADGNFKGIESTLRELDTALGKCTEAQRNQFTAMIGGKTQMDTLNALISGLNEEYSTLRASIEDSEGALNEMATTMKDNTVGNVEKMKSSLEGLGLQVGEHLLPHVNNLIDKISSLISWFGSLDEETQQTIMKMGLFAFAGGSALKVVGNLTTSVGGAVSMFGKFIPNLASASTVTTSTATAVTSATSGFTKLTTALGLTNPVVLAVAGGAVALGGALMTAKTHSDLMVKSAGTAIEDLNLFERAIASVTGMTFQSAEALEEAGIKAKEFHENVSEEFQTAVLNAEQSLQELSITLREMNLDEVFDESERVNFNSQVDSICQSAIETIKSKQDEATEELKKLFLSDGVISETEQKTLDFLNNQSQTQIDSINKTKEEINKIIAEAIEEKGYLNAEEQKQVNEHLASISSLELQAQANNQEELLASQAEFLSRVRNIDLEEASALMQEKATLRDTEMEAINAKYDKQIELLKMKNQSANEEERLNNEAIITQLEEQKNSELQIEQEKYDSYLQLLQENNSEVASLINEFNGEILSQADIQAQKELEKYASKYPDMLSITETGMYKLWNETKSKYDDVYVTVDETTKNIVGAWSNTQKKAGGSTEQIAKDAKKLGKEIKDTNDTITVQLSGMSEGFINSSGKIVDANGNVITSLEDFQKQADGTGKGILELNGKKIEIKSNVDGRIKDFEGLKNNINSLPTNRSINVNVYYKEHNKPAGIKSVGNYTMLERSMPAPAIASAFSIPDTSRAMPSISNFTFDTEATESIIQPRDISMFNDRVWSGGYFSPTSTASIELSRSGEYQKSTISQNNLNNGIDIKELGNVIAEAVAAAINDITLKGDFTLENGSLIGHVSNGLALNTKRRRRR